MLQLCNQYRALGIEVSIACCDAPNSPWLTSKLPFETFAFGPSTGNYSYCPKLLYWLKSCAANYDAVIIDGIWQYHSLAVRLALKNSNTPYYLFTHGMLDPWFKKNYPIKHLKKWLYWSFLEYKAVRDASSVIFTCEEERLLARKSFWLYKATESVASYGTTEPPGDSGMLRDVFLAKYPVLKDKKIILFLSRIHEKKGCDLLIRSFQRISQTNRSLHLIIAGPDQQGLTGKLKSLANDLGIADRVLWPGMLQGADKWGAYYASDVFCLPSHQENFGIVVAEALACGKPVLISNKVNIWREIERDEAGFVADDSVDGTEANLRNWLALSDQQYLAMCDRAKESFSSRFHIERAAERLIEIIKRTASDDRKNKHAAS